MSIEDKIKKWVALDNQVKHLQNQMQLLKDEKNELTNSLINHFDNANKKYPIINISDGKLSFIEIKQPNALSYKFLEYCLIDYFKNNANNANNANNNIKLIMELIKSKRTYTLNKTIKRVYS
jgi:hypothetical protein